MFESSFLEMLVIGIVALLVIGPERLPTVARTIGGWIGRIKRFVAKSKADIEHELRADELRDMLAKQEEELRNLKIMMNEKTAEVRKELEPYDKS
ncbi:Sec-independent protein translocase protein TatB [Thiofilum flexile]|uniref:Sec-independent protein translocase protein TatB n=1 Tax=Thiofilum flexile TaxID=125627 RepID=UPI000371C879|nr:Sec-independent protein translocase protein TatB [Thiofilum flexile]